MLLAATDKNRLILFSRFSYEHVRDYYGLEQHSISGHPRCAIGNDNRFVYGSSQDKYYDRSCVSILFLSPLFLSTLRG